ncbi:MAG: gliding motility-associated ABC transporter substrate-binding protein GldG [Bacteroidetes bacterium RIFCSPLOWO2_12_FULL_35_15]|nr:MAG: gliding motility-associated ABC transporter substrate-binding protein GldG [Bacteroidetes bacterium RIFCSPLOWO2_12_FULL_35_15]
MNKRNKKRDLTALGLAIIIVILLNFVGSFVFHRFDLTSEKRYTLSDATKNLLGDLNDVVYVKVYLDGDELNAGFKQLRTSTKEMLDEFRAYSNENIEYEFINPSANPDKKQQNEVYKQLFNKGLQPFNVEDKTESGTTQQLVWPGAIVSYKGREMPWQLLKTQLGEAPEAQLNNSVQALEYEFASCIRNLSIAVRPTIGFLDGHDELDTLSVKDISESLGKFYKIKRVKINEQLKGLSGLSALIIAKPDSAFTEKDKFIIDQFVMKGGKILWAIDPLYTSIDSLRKNGGTLAVPYDLKLEDMFFKYGVRLNPNLVFDMQASAIPINKALRGQQARLELMPWILSPLITPTGNHPIVKNLDLIKFDYVSSIDTVAAQGIKKTILLRTSKYSKIINSPVRIDLRMVNMQPDETQFMDSYQPVAVLLEGEFESVFKNRMAPNIVNDSAIGFKDQGVNNKMIIISDGDIIQNDYQYSTGKAFPLGFDKYTNRTYGNKNFILNCINYLCDDSGLISVRSRELTLRLLDKKKLKNERVKWQLINTLLPLFIILFFGIINDRIRKRRYTR